MLRCLCVRPICAHVYLPFSFFIVHLKRFFSHSLHRSFNFRFLNFFFYFYFKAFCYLLISLSFRFCYLRVLNVNHTIKMHNDEIRVKNKKKTIEHRFFFSSSLWIWLSFSPGLFGSSGLSSFIRRWHWAHAHTTP